MNIDTAAFQSKLEEIIAEAISSCNNTIDALASMSDISNIVQNAVERGISAGYQIIKKREVNA